MAAVQSPIPTATIDFLRGVAASYVVVNHVRGAFFIGGSALVAQASTSPLSLFDYLAIAFLRLTSLGTEFVVMFFCLSGMAMAHSVASSSSVLDFYYRRWVRIWPTYALAVGIAVAAAALMISINPLNPTSVSAAVALDPSRIAGMLFYLDVSTPLTPQFWSLPYEVTFYLLAPVLLMSRQWVLVSFVAAALLTVYAAAAVGIEINPAPTVVENFFLNAMFWFMAGAAGYHFYARIPRLRPIPFWCAAILLLVFVLAVKTAYGDSSNAVSNAAMVVLTLLTVRNLPTRIAEFRLTNWGRFSYSTYVYHYVLIALISFAFIEITATDPKQIRSYFIWIAVVPPVLGACYALYFLAERPSIAHLKRQRQSNAKAVARPVAPPSQSGLRGD